MPSFPVTQRGPLAMEGYGICPHLPCTKQPESQLRELDRKDPAFSILHAFHLADLSDCQRLSSSAGRVSLDQAAKYHIILVVSADSLSSKIPRQPTWKERYSGFSKNSLRYRTVVCSGPIKSSYAARFLLFLSF